MAQGAEGVAVFDEIVWMDLFDMKGNFRSISFFSLFFSFFFFSRNVDDLSMK